MLFRHFHERDGVNPDVGGCEVYEIDGSLHGVEEFVGGGELNGMSVPLPVACIRLESLRLEHERDLTKTLCVWECLEAEFPVIGGETAGEL